MAIKDWAEKAAVQKARARGRRVVDASKATYGAGRGAMSSIATRTVNTAARPADFKFFLFVLLALGVHVIDIIITQSPTVFLITTRIGIYLGIYFFGLWVFSSGANKQEVGRELLLYTFVAFGWPWLFNIFSWLAAKLSFLAFFSQMFATIAALVPVMLIYAARQQHVTSKYLHPLLKFLYVIIWVIITYNIVTSLGIPNTYLAESMVLGPDVGETVNRNFDALITTIVALPGDAINFGRNIITGGETAVKRQLAIATGDYYTGQVDKSQTQPLGVYLENLQGASPTFFEDESVIVWASIRARTLDPENPIDEIKVSCVAYKDTARPKYGDASPEETSTNFFILEGITETEEQDLVCEFEKGIIRRGSRKVTFDAEFDFSTMSYLKNYFIDVERKRSLVREGIDVFDEYGITDKQPVAIYSPGPVMVGMETTEPMVGVRNNAKFRLGITIDSAPQWKGHIKKINNLIIKVPNSVSLALCDANIKSTKCEGDYAGECEDGRYKRIYIVPQEQSKKGRRGLSNVKPGVPFTINCNVNVDNAAGLLGNVPVSTQYFKTTVDYVYELEQDVIVQMEKPLLLPIYQKISYMAEDMGIDPFLALGLAQHESKMIQSAKSDSKPPAYGIMQVRETTANDICTDSWEDIKENADANILCGLQVLKKYYETWGKTGNQDPLCGRATPETPPDTATDKEITDFKIEQERQQTNRRKYQKYRGWDAAVRAYNGWGCVKGAKAIPDVDFVKHVRTKQQIFEQDPRLVGT